MAFADVEAKTTITGFPEDDKATILGAMETAYIGSAIAKKMFDDFIANPNNTINIQFRADVFTANLGTGELFLDLSFLTDINYITPTGQAVRDTEVTAIVHELGHALTGRDDDGYDPVTRPSLTDFKGANVTFVNTIYKELGLPEQLSYKGADNTGILKRNFQYTNGKEIDRAVSKDLNLDTSHTGDSKDLLIGGPSANTLTSGDGNDFLYGASGNDTLNGGKNDDYLYGEDDNDVLNGEDGNADQLFGGAGNDTLNDFSGVAGAHGGDGNDSINITFAASWVNDNNVPRSDGKITGGAGNDKFYVKMNNPLFFLNMKGDQSALSNSSSTGDGKDEVGLYGQYAKAVVDLGGGNDTFSGGDGNDDVTGNDGDDVINGNKGNDRLVGGSGKDLLVGGPDNDTYVLGLDDSIIEVVESANEGTDTLEVPYSFSLQSSSGTNLENITLTGTNAIDASGDKSNNVLKGNNQNNTLIGFDGNDTLIGNGGEDTLVGGAGNDNLTGGAGTDRFVFKSLSEGIDKIVDFNTVDDQIYVSASKFGGGLVAGSSLSSDQFVKGRSAKTDENRFIYDAGKLLFDADGKGNANPIQIATLSNLTFSNIFVDV